MYPRSEQKHLVPPFLEHLLRHASVAIFKWLSQHPSTFYGIFKILEKSGTRVLNLEKLYNYCTIILCISSSTMVPSMYMNLSHGDWKNLMSVLSLSTDCWAFELCSCSSSYRCNWSWKHNKITLIHILSVLFINLTTVQSAPLNSISLQ